MVWIDHPIVLKFLYGPPARSGGPPFRNWSGHLRPLTRMVSSINFFSLMPAKLGAILASPQEPSHAATLEPPAASML